VQNDLFLRRLFRDRPAQVKCLSCKAGPGVAAKVRIDSRQTTRHIVFEANRPLPCRRQFASRSAGNPSSRDSQMQTQPRGSSFVGSRSLLYRPLPCGHKCDQVTRRIGLFRICVKAGFVNGWNSSLHPGRIESAAGFLDVPTASMTNQSGWEGSFIRTAGSMTCRRIIATSRTRVRIGWIGFA